MKTIINKENIEKLNASKVDGLYLYILAFVGGHVSFGFNLKNMESNLYHTEESLQYCEVWLDRPDKGSNTHFEGFVESFEDLYNILIAIGYKGQNIFDTNMSQEDRDKYNKELEVYQHIRKTREYCEKSLSRSDLYEIVLYLYNPKEKLDILVYYNHNKLENLRRLFILLPNEETNIQGELLESVEKRLNYFEEINLGTDFSTTLIEYSKGMKKKFKDTDIIWYKHKNYLDMFNEEK